MKVFTAALAAAASCGVGAAVVDILDGPEVADVLLPEVAHVFGVNYVAHSTFEDLKLRPEDVHVLPKAPNLEDALGALSGAPLTRQPKPFAHAVMMLDASNYDSAQIKIAEARAAELVASLAPKVEFAQRLRSATPVSFVPIDIAPGQYGNVPFIVFNSAIYGLLLPLALYGLRNAKSSEFIKKLLPGAAFFLGHNVSSIIIQNVLSFRGVLAVPISVCFGILAMLYAFRRAETLPIWSAACASCPCNTGLEKEPMGYCACERIYMFVVANLTYHGISSFLPYRFGLVGFVTSNIMIAGLLYLSYLLIVGTYMRQSLFASGDPNKKQRVILSLVCSYIAISALSFFADIIAVYFGFGDFIAFEPTVFFSTATVYELNLGTILATLAFLGMWGASYQELKAMEEQQKSIPSTSTLAVSTFEESSNELNQTLRGLQSRAPDICEQAQGGVAEGNSGISAKYVAYLRCIKDTWSSCHAAKMLDEDLIKYLKPRFVMLSTPLKVRVLTSLMYIKSSLREACIEDLLLVVKQGETDPNEWVKKLSRLLMPFMTSGRVDLRDTDTETAFRIINFLDEQKALHPEEGAYHVKGGLEAPHICDPTLELETALQLASVDATDDPFGAAIQLQSAGALELSLFTAKENIDSFLDGVVRKGVLELRKAERLPRSGQPQGFRNL